mmetsp:Transcript_78027/g.150751  ORF Transcript_78027/g.150751 Transcript_78027/m.150751 type:complete len:118 (+) Transcript_78027:2236-2589(+)
MAEWWLKAEVRARCFRTGGRAGQVDRPCGERFDGLQTISASVDLRETRIRLGRLPVGSFIAAPRSVGPSVARSRWLKRTCSSGETLLALFMFVVRYTTALSPVRERSVQEIRIASGV